MNYRGSSHGDSFQRPSTTGQETATSPEEQKSDVKKSWLCSVYKGIINSRSSGDNECGESADVQDPSESKKELYALKDSQVPDLFRAPFIVSGYRRPGLSFWECAKTLVRSSNETINVWSHLLALVLFMTVNMTALPTDDPFYLPLFSFAVGISILYVSSSAAHLFNCMSANSFRICFFFDYAAIGFYTFTAGQALFFYSRPAGASWPIFHSLGAFQTISAGFSFLVTVACCHSSQLRWRKHKAVVRVAFLVLNWLFITSPYTARLILYENDPAYNAVSTPCFKRHIVFCGLGALVYAARVPERLMSGVFDNFGQSHNLAHILIAMGIQQAFNTAHMDLQGRRALLLERFTVMPTFMNTLGSAVVVLIGNVAIVLLFAKKVCSSKSN